jgi:NAD(P)H-dependent flavin oxidoreductase YrpB (nitropropane dioxygenase family)
VSLRERLGLRHPIVCAGLGGGLGRAPLSVAVADAGGLGQIGTVPAKAMAAELAAHRKASSGPVAVNLLLPFARPEHWELARGADAVVTFWGSPRRHHEGIWVHQCGSVEEAQAAQREGADGVIVQGAEAGGHVRGALPALELLEQARAALPAGYPLWLAGGVAQREDASRALDAGADAVVAGTRFLLSEESSAHAEYKQRLLTAEETILTELFGAGWPAPHRVIANAATDRWLRDDPRGPAWIRVLHRATAPLLARAPLKLTQRLGELQRPDSPMLAPLPPTTDGPARLLDAGPLYAGACVARIRTLAPAGEIVRELSGT